MSIQTNSIITAAALAFSGLALPRPLNDPTNYSSGESKVTSQQPFLNVTAEKLKQVIESLTKEIKLEIYRTGQAMKPEMIMDLTLEVLLKEFRTNDIEPLVRDLVEHSYNLQVARELAAAWNRRSTEPPLWSFVFISAKPVGSYQIRKRTLYYAAFGDPINPSKYNTEALEFTHKLSPDEAKSNEVLQVVALHGARLVRISPKSSGSESTRVTELETFIAPSENVSNFSSGWLGESLKELAIAGQRNEFELLIRSRIASISQTKDGNLDHSPVFRETKMSFSFDPDMQTASEKLPNNTYRSRFDNFKREIVGLSSLGEILRAGLENEILANLSFWERESKFHHMVGKTLPIGEKLIDKVISTISGNGLPNSTFQDISKLPLQDRDLLVVHLFAMWCGSCKEQMPEIDKLQRELVDDRVSVISLCLNEAPRDSNGLLFFASLQPPNAHYFGLAKEGLLAEADTPVLPAFLVMSTTGKVLFAITPTKEKDELTLIKQFVKKIRQN